jgi:eukaryotic-like serine/threonine-protein kinase
MSLAPGARLGPYEILAPIGAGGMGEVYRARDPRLGRDVALKVLPAAFSADPDRLRRFEQEAHAAAALNHPNILAVYDIGMGAEAPFIVSELLEGQTLRERLRSGPLQVRKAITYALQIVRGLAAAHEKGITHRDLKPENLLVTTDGRVKILDFGLAKLTRDPAAGTVSEAPTATLHTEAGVVLGTVGYMAPEQVRGEAVDHRADLFTFGAILYELLSGQRAFQRGSAPETLTAILNDDPQDLLATDRPIPPGLARIVHRCLEKSAQARFQTASDLAFALDGLADASGDSKAAGPSKASRPRERLAWVALAVMTAVAAVAMALAFRSGPSPAETRLDITTPPTTDPASLAISPDGRKIVFVATSQGHPQLFVRALESVSARALPGTDGASLPFWAPDNGSVGFFADGKLKRIDIESGSVQELAEAVFLGGASWSRDNVILFCSGGPLPLVSVPAGGGEAVPATRLEEGHTGHSFPHFLPDGRHFTYYVRGGPDVRGVYLGQLGEPGGRRLLDAESGATYASSGHLLFVRQETLFAQAFDLDRLQLTGNASPVADQLAVGDFGAAAVSASVAGPIAYRTGAANDQRQFVWFDRSGTELGRVGDPGRGFFGLSLSRDGHRLAFVQAAGGNPDVWLLDVARGVSSRFTFDPADDVYPIWSPDGKSIVFSSNRKGAHDLYGKPAADTGREEVLLPAPETEVAMDWSRDGRFLLYMVVNPTPYSLWALPLHGDQKPFRVMQTDSDRSFGQFSPDGKMIAYSSTESGRWEIYVQPFPGPGTKSLVSMAGGISARWGPEGKELFYIALDDRLMAVPIQLASDGERVDARTAVPLFTTRVGGALRQTGFTPQYVVAPDGRFLMNTVVEDANASPITVILNWKAKP